MVNLLKYKSVLITAVICTGFTSTNADQVNHKLHGYDYLQKCLNDLTNVDFGVIVEKRVDLILQERINDGIGQRVNELVESRVNVLVESRVNELVESRINEIVESRVNEVVESRVNDIVESRVNEIVETRVNEIVELRVNEVVESRVNGKIDKRLTDGIENRITVVGNELLAKIGIIAKDNKIIQLMVDEAQALKPKSNEKDDKVTKRNNRRFVLDNAPFPGGIGFTACVSVSDLQNLGKHQPIVFDKVITNTGGAYHNHTGVFQAPLKGLYAFHLAAMTMPHRSQYLHFMKDGTVISSGYPDADNSSDTQATGNMWVMELDVGSEVWIRAGLAGEIHGNCYTVFSGFLLNELE